MQLKLSVEIDSRGMPLRDLRCSLHKNVVITENDGIYQIDLQPGERLDRDFILRYRIADERLTTFARLAPDSENAEEGTFMTVISAPGLETDLLIPRDVVLVLDRSGSMDGWKMECARRAVVHILESLTNRDRFALIGFDNLIEMYKPTLEVATDRERYQATGWLAGIHARGGTELLPALHQALETLTQKREEAVGIVVVVTDGQVGNEGAILQYLQQAGVVVHTVGIDEVGNETAILQYLQRTGVVVHTVGIDEAVNEYLLKQMADSTGGSCALVESEERLDEALDDIRRRLGAPVLTDIQIHAQGFTIQTDTVCPPAPRVLFQNSTLIVMGRYKGVPDNPVMTVTVRDNEGNNWQVQLVPQVAPHPAFTPVWARMQVRKLEEQYFLKPNPKLERAIVDTSLRYWVLSRFTAWVAVDPSEVANREGKRQHIVQPVDTPRGWEILQEARPNIRPERLMVLVRRDDIGFNPLMSPVLGSGARATDSPATGFAPITANTTEQSERIGMQTNPIDVVRQIYENAQARPPKNEQETIQRVVLPLLRMLAGYTPEIDLDFEHTSHAGRADIFYQGPSAECSLWIEVKDWNTALDDKHAVQLVNYVNTAGGRWGVLTNGQEWRLYDCRASHLPAPERLVFQASLSDFQSIVQFMQVIGKSTLDNCQVEAVLRPLRLARQIEDLLLNPSASNPLFSALLKALRKDFPGLTEAELEEVIRQVVGCIASAGAAFASQNAPAQATSQPASASHTPIVPPAVPSFPTQFQSWKKSYVKIVQWCYQQDPQKIVAYLQQRGELDTQPRKGQSGYILTTPLDPNGNYHFYTTFSSGGIQTRLNEIAKIFGLSGIQITVRGETFTL